MKKVDAIMIIAHPDDDGLFGGCYQLATRNLEWAIVCLTHHADNFRGKELLEWQTSIGTKRENIHFLDFPDDPQDIKKDQASFSVDEVVSALKDIPFTADLILTHNEIGEYGHIHHRVLHQAVSQVFDRFLMFGHYLDDTDIQINADNFVIPLAKAFTSQAEIVHKYHNETNCCKSSAYAWHDASKPKQRSKTYAPATKRYETMTFNRCGQSGLMLPAVSLGLWHNFGGVDDQANARALLHYAFDNGITHFDLANNYGPPPGSAESFFGEIISTDFAPYRDEMIISTKAGYRMWDGPYGEWGSRKYLTASLDQSLKRMKLDYVDIFYSHRPDPNTPLEETMSALVSAVEQGKALYVGISSYTAEDTLRAHAILKDQGIHCLIHQPSYSMFNRWIEADLLEALQETGMGCISFSPLAQGQLTNKYLNGIPEDSRAAKDHGFLKSKQVESKIETVKALNAIAEARGQSLAQMALAWVLRHDVMTSVLVGASKVSQLEDNLNCLNKLSFTEEETAAIDALTG